MVWNEDAGGLCCGSHGGHATDFPKKMAALEVEEDGRYNPDWREMVESRSQGHGVAQLWAGVRRVLSAETRVNSILWTW